MKTEQRSRQRATNQRLQDIRKLMQLYETESVQSKPVINKKSLELAKKKIPADVSQKMKRLNKRLSKNDIDSVQ